jgi:kynureninase
MKFEATAAFAKSLDKADPLKSFRKKFFLPSIQGNPMIYFCGNSLGLQPLAAEKYLMEELHDWRTLGVEGHLHSRRPWFYYHHYFTDSLCALTGARKSEVVCMNQLTVNLNLLMASFYRPQGKKRKIMIESSAFPSDFYAVEQQIRWHGLSPDKNILELQPRQGEVSLRTSDILKQMDAHAGETALFLLGAVNYYTGQYFDIPAIARRAKKLGITLGLDLAHAIGNVPLELHKWNIDFATWCSYKYLNSGPGAVSGIFVHERHGNNPELPRLAGWWGNEEDTRFSMQRNFVPAKGAAGWQMSNAPVMNMAAHRASLDLFDEAGMKRIREKSILLTAYLEFLIQHFSKERKEVPFRIITPSDPAQRGAQMSIQTLQNGKQLFRKLEAAGIVADWREPDVIRVAPAPLYNTFEEVFRFARILCS